MLQIIFNVKDHIKYLIYTNCDQEENEGCGFEHFDSPTTTDRIIRKSDSSTLYRFDIRNVLGEQSVECRVFYIFKTNYQYHGWMK